MNELLDFGSTLCRRRYKTVLLTNGRIIRIISNNCTGTGEKMDKFYFQYRNLRAGSPFPAEKFEREEITVNMLV